MLDIVTLFWHPAGTLTKCGQAQKDVTHNEALALIDACLVPSAEALGIEAPPASPVSGQCWIIGETPTGVWAGHADALTAWTDGGWRFLDAVEGMRVWIKQDQLWATYSSEGWKLGEETATKLIIGGDLVVGTRQSAVEAPAGGATVDTEARAAIAAIIDRLEQHGLIEPAA